MVTAFQTSEIPTQDAEKAKIYYSQTTTSQAILTACDAISNAIETWKADAIEAKSSENEIVRKLIWPLQILEMLVRNNE